MLNEVRSLDWETFSRRLEEHYGPQQLKAEIKFGPHSEELRQFALYDNDGSVVRDLTPDEGLEEIRKILFPGEKVRIVSVCRSRETMFGSERLHLALQPLE